MESSDSSLVRAARAGSKSALSVLVQRHRPLTLSLCRRMLGDLQLAEDAAQEAVIQAILNLDRLRRPQSFGSWLAGIGLNVCRKWLRTTAAGVLSWEVLQGGMSIPDVPGLPGPEDAAQTAELVACVREAVAALPDGQRGAVLLFYLSGLTYEETAAQLGLPVPAVKSRLHRARESLRRRLWAAWKEGMMVADLRSESVEVRVADVRRREAEGEKLGHGHFIVLLEEVSGGRQLPIWVGAAEGSAIALELEKVQVPRPLTIVFAAALLKATGARLEKAVIQKLVDETFYATAVIETSEGTQEVDARPSDAIALALATGASILVERSVFDASDSSLAGRRERGESTETEGEGFQGAGDIVADITAKWPTSRR